MEFWGNLKLFKRLVWTMFALYLILLIKVIFFKYGLQMTLLLLRDEHRYVANLMPFKTIFSYVFRQGLDMITIKNILGNIIAFCPMGFLLPILFMRQRSIATIAICFCFSLSFEVIQILTNIGSFDVDDLILNTVGSTIGLLLYKATACLFTKK